MLQNSFRTIGFLSWNVTYQRTVAQARGHLLEVNEINDLAGLAETKVGGGKDIDKLESNSSKGLYYKTFYPGKLSNCGIGFELIVFGILRNSTVRNQNEFIICSRKNNSFMTIKFCLRFWQNLTKILVILRERKCSQELVYAQMVSVNAVV